MTEEEIMMLNSNEVETILNNALEEASNNINYEKAVFETSYVYFIIADKKI